MIRRTHEDPIHETQEENPFDELALELSHRRLLLNGFDDINHIYPDLKQMEKTECENYESDTETETSDSEQEPEVDQDSKKETDPDSASD